MPIIVGRYTGGALAPSPSPAASDWQRNLWVIAIAELLTLMAFQASFVLIPYHIQQLGVTDPREVAKWTGAFQSLGSISFALATPVWGLLGDRYGRKLMLVRAMIATTVVLALLGLVRTPTQLLLLRVVQGCTTGTPAAAQALVATDAPKHRLAYALGIIQTALYVGMSLGPMLGGVVGDWLGYRSTFFLASTLCLIALLVTAILAREPERARVTQESSKRIVPARESWRDLVRSPRSATLVGFVLVTNLAYGLVGPALPILVQELVAKPERVASVAGTVTGAAALTGAVAAMAIGRMSDRVGYWRVLVVCVTGAAVLFVPQAFVGSALLLGSLRAIQGLFQGGLAPTLAAMLVSGGPQGREGALLGLSSSASSIGFAVGPALGAIAMRHMEPGRVFLMPAVALGAIAAALMLSPHSRDASATIAAQEPATRVSS
jgi:MFS transporter, DHA1 family, multidrug resistance protein